MPPVSMCATARTPALSYPDPELAQFYIAAEERRGEYQAFRPSGTHGCGSAFPDRRLAEEASSEEDGDYPCRCGDEDPQGSTDPAHSGPIKREFSEFPPPKPSLPSLPGEAGKRRRGEGAQERTGSPPSGRAKPLAGEQGGR